MRRFGARVEARGSGVWRTEPTGYTACDLAIEPDASAATYVWAAEVLTGGRIDLGLASDGFTQPDAAAHALIARVPTLAVLAAFNREPVRFTGVANLRVKECDRLRALATELNRLSPGLAREDGDELVVGGGRPLSAPSAPVRLRTYADHRMAMSLSLLGLRLPYLEVEDPACVAKTFPSYWDMLRGLGVSLEEAD